MALVAVASERDPGRPALAMAGTAGDRHRLSSLREHQLGERLGGLHRRVAMIASQLAAVEALLEVDGMLVAKRGAHAAGRRHALGADPLGAGASLFVTGVMAAGAVRHHRLLIEVTVDAGCVTNAILLLGMADVASELGVLRVRVPFVRDVGVPPRVE